MRRPARGEYGENASNDGHFLAFQNLRRCPGFSPVIVLVVVISSSSSSSSSSSVVRSELQFEDEDDDEDEGD